MHDVDRMRLETEMEQLGEAYESGEATEFEYEGPLDEVQEMELATELLEVGDEAELEGFLSRLITPLVPSPGARRMLAKALRRHVRRALLPVGGGAVGSELGLELEGLSGEEQELEVARHLVRLAADAAGEAAVLQERGHPADAARIAVDRAARRHAPGLITSDGARGSGPYLQRRRSGRWVRRGRSIVLLDI
jgi:hypothetical protein